MFHEMESVQVRIIWEGLTADAATFSGLQLRFHNRFLVKVFHPLQFSSSFIGTVMVLASNVAIRSAVGTFVAFNVVVIAVVVAAAAVAIKAAAILSLLNGGLKLLL